MVVKDTPNLIKKILSFLETLNSVENKKVVLRVISLLGENKENTMEIGRLEGFRQILKLLLAEDQELTREILQTIKHLLDAQSTVPNSLLTGEAAQRAAYLQSLLPTRVRQTFTDVTKMFLTEMHKVFSKGKARLFFFYFFFFNSFSNF